MKVVATPQTLPGQSSELSSQVNRRAKSAMARARLRSELRAIVLDVLGPSEPSELPEDVAAWTQQTADTAASSACDTALTALLTSIEATFAEAPAWVTARLTQAAARRDAGID